MEQQRYRARWIDKEGRQRELIFESPGGLGIARIDLRLKLMEKRVPLPDEYQLEEVPRSVFVSAGGS